jgi:hypothetical protein
MDAHLPISVTPTFDDKLDTVGRAAPSRKQLKVASFKL